MPAKVTFVELLVWDRGLPLVSGYLQAYACTDSFLKDSYAFEIYSPSITTPRSTILSDLEQTDSDVYALSCYIWNTGLVRSLLRTLLERKPNAHFILGGPQVMNRGHKYLDPQYENLVLCNGEGERTFADWLRALASRDRDFSTVRGLSFHKNGQLVTTESQERITDLNEIPSPFLTGVFQHKPYYAATFETSRGCPFKCGFCFWGAATNDRVYKFDEDRIREEILWLCKQEVLQIQIADANWGMLKRDLALTQYLAECKKQYGTPRVVYFSSAKNHPDKVVEISEVLHGAGVMTQQAVSMQTLDPTSLGQIDRSNIKASSYIQLQEKLDEKHISSVIELIWPLPGETLSTFKEGIGELCRAKATSILVYVHLLLPNTTLDAKRDEFSFVTVPAGGEVGEAEAVVQTADVSYEEFQEGMWYFYALQVLYNARCLFALGNYLNTTGVRTHRQLFSDFANYMKQNRFTLAQFCRTAIENTSYDVSNYGIALHIVLHSHRCEFDEYLHRFVSSQKWWDDDKMRFLFELDLVNRPYLYNNTPTMQESSLLQQIEVLNVERRCSVIRLPEEHTSVLKDHLGVHVSSGKGSCCYRLDHERIQRPYVEARGEYYTGSYCLGMIQRIKDVMPTWTEVSTEDTFHVAIAEK